MSKRITVELRDEYVDALEVVKSLLMTDERTGITHDTPIDTVYHECANVGLAILSSQMMDEGIYEKHRAEVDLGNEIDEILGGQQR